LSCVYKGKRCHTISQQNNIELNASFQDCGLYDWCVLLFTIFKFVPRKKIWAALPLLDIINNIKGGIIDFSIINNGSVKCEEKINPWSHRYLNNVFVKAYYKFFVAKSGL
jgi:hypothetical protein